MFLILSQILRKYFLKFPGLEAVLQSVSIFLKNMNGTLILFIAMPRSVTFPSIQIYGNEGNPLLFDINNLFL